MSPSPFPPADRAPVTIPDARTIVVVGLGYVGLPLAMALAAHFAVWGLDHDACRIAELRRGHDRTAEITGSALAASSLTVTDDPADCPPADLYIVTVPTPVDAANRPDVSLLHAACRTVGAMLDASRRPIVVFESTVYPGLTENMCAHWLEAASGLTCGRDFRLGYSPERINPGDRDHSVDRIVKVVAGQTPDVTEALAEIYGAITSGGVFRAASIAAAEAAKVIENAQRDINIAFMNEVAQIVARMDLPMGDVLDAARTKWNFLPFAPGLVGGHCVGVDPYWLSHRAAELGHDPRIILAGRATNDAMASWIADRLHAVIAPRSRVLMLGLTFKEDVPDLRNSKVADLVRALMAHGHDVTVHDPLADGAAALREHGIALDPDALARRYDLVVLAVPHRAYVAMGFEGVAALAVEGGRVADWRDTFADARRTRDARLWTL